MIDMNALLRALPKPNLIDLFDRAAHAGLKQSALNKIGLPIFDAPQKTTPQFISLHEASVLGKKHLTTYVSSTPSVITCGQKVEFPEWPEQYRAMNEFEIHDFIEEGRHLVLYVKDRESGEMGYLKEMGTTKVERAQLASGEITNETLHFRMRREFAAHTTAQCILGERSVPNIQMVMDYEGNVPRYAVFTEEVRHCRSLHEFAQHHGEEMFFVRNGRAYLKIGDMHNNGQLEPYGMRTWGRIGLSIVSDFLGEDDENECNQVIVMYDDIVEKGGEPFLKRKAGRMVRFDWECAYKREVTATAQVLADTTEGGFLERVNVNDQIDRRRLKDIKAAVYQLIASIDQRELEAFTDGIAAFDLGNECGLVSETQGFVTQLLSAHQKYSDASQILGPPENPLIVHQISASRER